ncbi:Iojap-like ribosome-associated protein [Phytophthora cinnamomi]|uniref:Iojap-like ribosome-associated protein n=1 Tax=Phytophthora cinnamomi TaxID=4785 RepID=UPI0035597889|nr:Iojap-like ribosome-associated protein [Phytophthora cinnamomi]
MRSQLVRRALRAAASAPARAPRVSLPPFLQQHVHLPLRPLQLSPVRHFSNDHEAASNAANTDADTEAPQYLGVTFDAAKVKKYSAELELEGHVISGGDYWTALDAAKAYDELVTLYCELDAPRNFPEGDADAQQAETAEDVEWQAPEAGNRHADIIPPVPQTYLTIDEVQQALEREKAIDVYTVDLAGKSSLADFMVFATGRSQAHMRRMADLLIKSMKARAIVDDFDYAVEGRDCDDWMIADCNNIVVHLMRADTRRILALEDHWENMVDDKHSVYGDMNEDEYMDKFGTSELMEYLEDEDHPNEDGEGSGVEWK